MSISRKSFFFDRLTHHTHTQKTNSNPIWCQQQLLYINIFLYLRNVFFFFYISCHWNYISSLFWVRQRCCVSFSITATNWYWASISIIFCSRRDKGVCFCFFCSSTFILFSLILLSFSFQLLSLLSLFSLSLGDNTKWPLSADVLLNPNTEHIFFLLFYRIQPVTDFSHNSTDAMTFSIGMDHVDGF